MFYNSCSALCAHTVLRMTCVYLHLVPKSCIHLLCAFCRIHACPKIYTGTDYRISSFVFFQGVDCSSSSQRSILGSLYLYQTSFELPRPCQQITFTAHSRVEVSAPPTAATFTPPRPDRRSQHSFKSRRDYDVHPLEIPRLALPTRSAPILRYRTGQLTDRWEHRSID